MHPNTILWFICLVFACYIVCRAPSYCNRGAGTVTWGLFPWGCEDTVVRSRLHYKGRG